MGSTRNYRETNVTMRRFVITQLTGDEAAGSQTAADDNGARTGMESTEENKTEKQASTVQEWQGRMQFSAGKIRLRSSESQTLDNIRQRTVRYIFDLLFSYRRDRISAWRQENGYGNASGGETGNTQQGALFNEDDKILQPRSSVTLRVLDYRSETLHIESEDTTFSTVGKVKTADGREIDFNINVGMSREFQSHFSEDLHLASFTLCDPLVINLDSDVADVQDQTFYFDLDADGEMDEVSQLGKGSGYLALDKNGDGVINDGNELFGTTSGNGFADLAKYDEDGNGWIDENDAIWDKLKIWCKDENGKDVLYRLADKGVGAICLQNTATDFTLQGQGGRTQGVVRSTGVFLYENGLAGTIQHVDMAKYDMGA
ncbi:MAG: hypothetical protein NC305_02580 [Lachnospiraceae bacterium]|nr:hypothetical protein [Butyrivibrio sp.]MCM1345448.1 hypothetical protein [Muribaculaceae bacterium]MCM1409414.1 hypothetical protein [Lachnospiraceae bacterium]